MCQAKALLSISYSLMKISIILVPKSQKFSFHPLGPKPLVGQKIQKIKKFQKGNINITKRFNVAYCKAQVEREKNLLVM